MKQSQAALEFLMTYGWALLMVLSLIGLLVYFGVIDVDKIITNSCVSTPGIDCQGYPYVNATIVSFTLINNLYYDITILGSNATPPNTCGSVYVCAQGDFTCTNTTLNIRPRQIFTMHSSCNTRNWFNDDFIIPYINNGNGLKDHFLTSINAGIK